MTESELWKCWQRVINRVMHTLSLAFWPPSSELCHNWLHHLSSKLSQLVKPLKFQTLPQLVTLKFQTATASYTTNSATTGYTTEVSNSATTGYPLKFQTLPQLVTPLKFQTVPQLITEFTDSAINGYIAEVMNSATNAHTTGVSNSVVTGYTTEGVLLVSTHLSINAVITLQIVRAQIRL